MSKGKGREAKAIIHGSRVDGERQRAVDGLRGEQGHGGVAEREAVPVMLDDARQRGYRPKTLGGDKGYDTRECVRAMRNRGGDASRSPKDTLGDRWTHHEAR